MADQSGLSVLIVRLVFTESCRFPYCAHGLIQCRMMQKACFDRNHIVASAGINSADQLSPRPLREGRNRFIPIMPWILHPDHRAHLAQIPHQLFHRFLFFPQLLLIGQRKKRAASAPFLLQTACVFLSFHVLPLIILSISVSHSIIKPPVKQQKAEAG